MCTEAVGGAVADADKEEGLLGHARSRSIDGGHFIRVHLVLAGFDIERQVLAYMLGLELVAQVSIIIIARPAGKLFAAHRQLGHDRVSRLNKRISFR
jgi:hypothetical protein